MRYECLHVPMILGPPALSQLDYVWIMALAC